jgi:hypothetical protein
MARMGRPPIGKRAMTSTERSRRYRAGKTVKPEPATTPQAEPSAENDQEIVRREREQLRAIRAILRLAEVKRERDHYKQMVEGPGVATKRTVKPVTKPSPETERERSIDTALIESIIRLLQETNEQLEEMLRIERIEAAPDGRIHLIIAPGARPSADDRIGSAPVGE